MTENDDGHNDQAKDQAGEWLQIKKNECNHGCKHGKPCQYGAEGDIARQRHHSDENGEADERNWPTYHQEGAKTGANATPSTESNVNRPVMPDNRCRPTSHNPPGVHCGIGREDGPGKPHRSGSFDQVSGEDESPGFLTSGAQHVCHSHAATTVIPDIDAPSYSSRYDAKGDCPDKVTQNNHANEH